MKKISVIATLFLMVFAFTGCGGSSAQQQAQSPQSNKQESVQNNTNQTPDTAKKVLIVYYSRSGNTREIATQIQQKVGGDILEIKTVKPYPQSYDETTKQARQELDSGFKPELQPININIAQYDTIIIGSPLWWSTVSTPVISFLTQYDLSGKTIIPFVTHGGSGIARSVTHIKELCPKADVKEGIAIRGSNVQNSQNELTQWLQQLKMI